MPARRRPAAVVTAVTALGIAALTLSATPASAHGSLGDPVSRVAQCYAEGPESPASAACRAAVTAGGTQALYDWNGIRIGDAGGRHRALIPDGELCGAGNDEFKGLDLARADWPATGVHSGSYPFRYRVTAPHKGTFEIYLTKPGYDAAKPLSWADLDLEHPVATATDPVRRAPRSVRHALRHSVPRAIGHAVRRYGPSYAAGAAGGGGRRREPRRDRRHFRHPVPRGGRRGRPRAGRDGPVALGPASRGRRRPARSLNSPGPGRRLRPAGPRRMVPGRVSRPPTDSRWRWRAPGRGRSSPRGTRSGRARRWRRARRGPAGTGPGSGRCARRSRSGTGCGKA